MSLCKNLSQKCARFAAFSVLVAASALAAQAQVIFSPPKDISNSSGNTQSQQIAMDANGKINLVWADNSVGNYAIFFSRSSDTGNTFSTPRSISRHARSTASVPLFTVDSSGNIYVVWTETDPSGQFNFVYFSRSADGVTFTNPQNISGDAGAATGPRIEVDSSSGVYVVWVDTSVGNSEIFFSHSADGGATFSTPLNISNDAGSSLAPGIGVDARGNIYVAWADNTPTAGGRYDVFFSRSADGGATFSTPMQITHSNGLFFVDSFLQIAIARNGNLDLFWIQGNQVLLDSASVLFTRSTDGGATFSTPSTALSFATSGSAALDPSGNVIGVVGVNGTIDQEFPYVDFSFSSDGGNSFSRGGQISNYGAGSPQIAVDPIGRFDIIYNQGFAFVNPPSQRLGFFFTQIVNGGDGAGAVLSSALPTSSVMALDSSANVYVAWRQLSSSGSGGDIFFSRGAVTPFSLSISPQTVVGGSDSSTGTVKLISPAPSGGAVISLSSSNPAATVPASVAVPEGATGATFNITSSQVSSDVIAKISATYSGGTNTATLVVGPLFQIRAFGPVTGGFAAFGQVLLTEPAPSGGLTVALSSSNSSVASVPMSATVSAGSIFANFSIATSPVSTPTTVQITGTSNGVMQTTSLTVNPPALGPLTLSPTTATGGASSIGTVTLNGPAPAGGVVISLSSSDPSATVPASVTIPAGSTSTTFTITTNPGSSTTNVTISASYNGVTVSVTFTVHP